MLVLQASSAGQSVATPQPQTVLPLTQAWPLALPAQLTQAAPHAVAPSVTQEPPWQHVAPPQVPSLPEPQAAVHEPPEPHVGVPPEQGVHAPPPSPHAPLPPPATHCPRLQQPPLHPESFPAPHARPQVWDVVLHARPGGQSVARVQPHIVSPLTHAVPLPFPAQLIQDAPQAVGPSATQALPWQHVVPPHVPFPATPHADVHVLPPAHVGVPFAQGVHAAPVLPQNPLAVPATHWLVAESQHPPLHAVSPAPHAVPHTCVVVLQALPAPQSVASVQPHVPFASQADPLALPTQLVQLPLIPQAPGAVPAAHVVPLQQPTLHAVSPATPHAVPHVCVAVLQALPAGQSVATLQPHVGVPAVSHTCPVALTVQFAHDPAAPHAPGAVPATHCEPLQQPLLHAVCVAPPHAVLHVCVVVLHELPLGQSADALHPHASVDAMQTEPAAFPAQVTQAPDPPHEVLLVPGRHDPPDPQQPAVQGEAGSEHENVQRSVVVLHPALLAGQLAVVVQPHCPPPVVGSHALPLVPAVKPAVQLAHRPPLLPHAVVPVPAWHVPPVAAEQHPPLHDCVELHDVVHVLVVVSHASSAGQSEAVRQPHVLDAVPGTHAEPLALLAHDAQAA